MRKLLVLLTALVLAACSSSSGTPSPSELNDRNGSGPYDGAGVVPPQPRPAFTLTDTAGKTFNFATATAGHPTLLYFGYTHCPDVCPATMADITVALRAVSPTLRAATKVVFVTTDPKRDTAARITTWLSALNGGLTSNFVGLYGSQAAIDSAQAAAHVTVAEDGGQTHAAQVLLYGADDYARVEFPQSDNESDQIAHDLPLVAGSKK